MYIDDHNLLKEKLNFDDDYIAVGSIAVRSYTFRSKNAYILPGADTYSCTEHDFSTEEPYHSANHVDMVSGILDVPDALIQDNIIFRYHVFSPVGQTEKAKEVVMLLHGLNEKDWDKYYTWAKAIVDRTGKTVVLFPLGFHMNRTPKGWSDSRLMYQASSQRREVLPNVIASSLSNVAISKRLHEKPQRFVWSGLQTYYDILDFIEDFKAGNHPMITPDAHYDFFAYSIGAFLSQILVISNYKGYFDNSKLCMFCGGPVFNRFSPVTKFILDSEANVVLYSFLVEHLESHLKKDARLNHYLNGDHIEGVVFRAMLDYKVSSELRENAFRKLSSQIMAIGLKQDTVIPPYEIINTLQGKYRDIPIKVDMLDFSYKYKHEDPFPAIEKLRKETDEAFNSVFEFICKFLVA
ncbi:MAG: DUF6051 family protein [Prevotellaceae bacterium]|jgi:hypothetical protein|nr:DUF6051 family protein [Prevotellaceae bacterium]